MIKKGKLKEFIFILVIVTIFGFFGYYTYKSYSNKVKDSDESVKINDFYNIDYLFNNNYLESAKEIGDLSSDDLYMYLDADNVLYVKSTEEAVDVEETIKGLGTGKYTIYYNLLFDGKYELAAKDENNSVYYVSFDINDNSNEGSFVKIADKIKGVYHSTYDKDYIFINKNKDFVTNFVFVDKSKQLNYLDYSGDEYTLKSNFKEKKTYFDYVCASDKSDLCNNLIVYKTFNDEIVYNNKVLKIDDKVVYAKDMFSSFEIKSDDDIDIGELNYSDLKKYEYLFVTYIIDEKGLLYKLDISNDDTSFECINKTSDKVKQIDYGTSRITIVFNNGDEEVISKEKNKVLSTSTMHDRTKNDNPVKQN